MNIYLVEYEDLDFNEHQQYFLRKETADNYARKIIMDMRDKINNNDFASKVYEEDRFKIELRYIEKSYTENHELYPIKFLEKINENIVKRKLLFNKPIIEYVLAFNIIDKDENEVHESIFTIKIKTIEVMEG